MDDRKVTVEVEGTGVFCGIDNGDLRRSVPFGASQKQLSTYFGKALVRVSSTRKGGEIRVKMQVEGIEKPITAVITSK